MGIRSLIRKQLAHYRHSEEETQIPLNNSNVTLLPATDTDAAGLTHVVKGHPCLNKLKVKMLHGQSGKPLYSHWN